MYNYNRLVKNILKTGKRKHNRTGVDTVTIPSAMLKFDLGKGFPLMTTKKMFFKNVKVELEFFIRGLTDKEWLKDRKCNIWNNWSSPTSKNDSDLGPIYGYQWRNFNGVDQLKNIVKTLKTNPDDRRLIVSAWNPGDLKDMALPPCHLLFNCVVIDGVLNLNYYQRSTDVAIGLPYDIALYALLLHLLAKECGLKEGLLTCFLSDVHIYMNHIKTLKRQLEMPVFSPPTIKTVDFDSIFDWTYKMTSLENYQSNEYFYYEVAV